MKNCLVLGAWCLVFGASPICPAMTPSDAVAIILNSKRATGEKAFAAAKERVEIDAAEGKPLQQFVIGITTDDKDLAKRYLDSSREKIRTLAAEKDNPLAWYLLAVEKNDRKLLRRAAKGGNVQAQNALGAILIQETMGRDNIPSNIIESACKEGFVLFSKAAEQGDPNGFINLGMCYQQGFGCEKDMEEAFNCFKSAAEAEPGHPEGMDRLSDCYRRGCGIERDDALSLYWEMRGRAARGNDAAEQWLRDRK